MFVSFEHFGLISLKRIGKTLRSAIRRYAPDLVFLDGIIHQILHNIPVTTCLIKKFYIVRMIPDAHENLVKAAYSFKVNTLAFHLIIIHYIFVIAIG